MKAAVAYGPLLVLALVAFGAGAWHVGLLVLVVSVVIELMLRSGRVR